MAWRLTKSLTCFLIDEFSAKGNFQRVLEASLLCVTLEAFGSALSSIFPQQFIRGGREETEGKWKHPPPAPQHFFGKAKYLGGSTACKSSESAIPDHQHCLPAHTLCSSHAMEKRSGNEAWKRRIEKEEAQDIWSLSWSCVLIQRHLFVYLLFLDVSYQAHFTLQDINASWHGLDWHLCLRGWESEWTASMDIPVKEPVEFPWWP